MKINLILLLFIFIFSDRFGVGEQVPSPEKKIVYFLTGFWEDDIFEEKAEAGFYHKEPLFRLYQKATAENYDLRIADGYADRLIDLSKPESAYPLSFDSIVVFEIVPHQFEYLQAQPSEKLVLFLWEPPTTMPINYEPENHQIFSRIYTWRDDLVDNQKYFKIYYPVLRKMAENPIAFENRKLCVLVAANKSSWLPNELYTERKKVIDFFEEKHPEDFDLYGGGWPESQKSFKGEIKNGLLGKVEVLKGYKFAFAYENSKDIPGYVTEKIFDCFAAGIVPIYLGAPNIATYIPKNCYISREEFKDNEELFAFLKQMKKEQYMEYLTHIRAYMASDQAKLFSSEHFVEIMLEMLKRTPKASEENDRAIQPMDYEFFQLLGNSLPL